MRIQAKVTKVIEARNGHNAQTGKDWTCTDLLLAFEESAQNGAPIEHSTVASCWSKLDMEKVNEAIKNCTLLTIFLKLDTRDWNGRSYCENRVTLPTEFYLNS